MNDLLKRPWLWDTNIVGEKGAVNLLQNAGRTFGKEVGLALKEDNFDRYLEKLVSFVEKSKVGLVVPVEVSKNRIVVQIDE